MIARLGIGRWGLGGVSGWGPERLGPGRCGSGGGWQALGVGAVSWKVGLAYGSKAGVAGGETSRVGSPSTWTG